jgi:hypothetical protein
MLLPSSGTKLHAVTFCHFRELHSLRIAALKNLLGAPGRARGRGNALRAGWSGFRFPIVSLGFSVDLIHPAAL